MIEAAEVLQKELEVPNRRRALRQQPEDVGVKGDARHEEDPRETSGDGDPEHERPAPPSDSGDPFHRVSRHAPDQSENWMIASLDLICPSCCCDRCPATI